MGATNFWLKVQSKQWVTSGGSAPG